VVAEWHL